MTLLELYNLKLHEYKQTGIRERPDRLLALLLLPERDKFEPKRMSEGDFYRYNKDKIDSKIDKIIKDFELTKEDIIKYIEESIVCNDYNSQRIWFVFAEGFGCLHWGLLYQKNKSPEEIYIKYFNIDELNRPYDLEQLEAANNIRSKRLDEILDKILENPDMFYERICDELSLEERRFILRKLKNKACSSCTNENCNVEASEKVGLDEQGLPQGHDCIGWFNSRLIGKSKVLRIDDIDIL